MVNATESITPTAQPIGQAHQTPTQLPTTTDNAKANTTRTTRSVMVDIMKGCICAAPLSTPSTISFTEIIA